MIWYSAGSGLLQRIKEAAGDFLRCRTQLLSDNVHINPIGRDDGACIANWLDTDERLKLRSQSADSSSLPRSALPDSETGLKGLF